MNRYSVAVPFTGVMVIELDAENEDSAKDNALNFSEEIILDVISYENEDDIHVELSSLEYHSQICEGNIFHGCQNTIDVELVETEED